MKKVIIFVFLLGLLMPFQSFAYVSVKGYYKKNGTYVAPHVRSNPNGLKSDNYSYKGGSVYNKTYGTRGSTWDTPTYITDPDYYIGKSLYENNSYGAYNYSTSYRYPSAPIKKVIAPANSTIYGSDWYCNAGYKTQYDSLYNKIGCQQIFVPANATVFGSDWYCNVGYSTKYDSSFNKIGCEQMNIPVSVSSAYYTPSAQNNNDSNSMGKNYYLNNHTCIGLSGDQYSSCITYASNH